MTFRRSAVGPGTVGLALALLLAGCVYYPTVGDIGGARLAPERGRVVRNGDGALLFVDITNSGLSEDFLVRVEVESAENGLTDKIAEGIRGLVRLRADVEIVPLGSIPEDAKRLEDLRA